MQKLKVSTQTDCRNISYVVEYSVSQLKFLILLVSGDTEAYLLDEEKALVWLTTKVENVAKYFQQKKLTRSEASVSSNFIRPTESDDKR